MWSKFDQRHYNECMRDGQRSAIKCIRASANEAQQPGCCMCSTCYLTSAATYRVCVDMPVGLYWSRSPLHGGMHGENGSNLSWLQPALDPVPQFHGLQAEAIISASFTWYLLDRTSNWYAEQFQQPLHCNTLSGAIRCQDSMPAEQWLSIQSLVHVQHLLVAGTYVRIYHIQPVGCGGPIT